MASDQVKRKLAAILAADIAGYSRLMGADEAGTLARLKKYRRELIDPKNKQYRGRVVKTTGDGILIEFPSVVDAISCSLEVQQGMRERNADVPPEKRIAFRIGINLGDVIVEGRDLYGDGVNIAARLEGLSEPGGICISQTVLNHARGKIAFNVEDLGEQALKNIVQPIHVYRLLLDSSQGSAVSRPSQPVLTLPDKPSIAVLPFQNMSGDPEQEYFADGMVEEIITALSRNKQLFVIARNSSFTFKGRPVDIKQVARELGVRYVLEGSVRKAGNRIRITGQLIDAASGGHLWADRFEGALEDVFELQDQVASSVVGAIDPSVTRAEIERAQRKPTNSLDAYDYYLRGQAANWQFTRDGTDQAVGLYEQAIALDPQFASAYAALAAVLSQRKGWGWSTDPAADASRALAYAKSALSLPQQDDPSIMARSALVLMFQGDEVELADGLLEEAIRLDPNQINAWVWGGWAKMTLGKHQTAIDYFQRALRLSPLDPRIFYAQSGLAFAHFFLSNYEEGLKHASAASRHHPNYAGALRAAMACNALSGNTEAAQKLWQQVALLSPSDRVSETRKRAGYRRDEDLAKLQQAYRLAGMPE